MSVNIVILMFETLLIDRMSFGRSGIFRGEKSNIAHATETRQAITT